MALHHLVSFFIRVSCTLSVICRCAGAFKVLPAVSVWLEDASVLLWNLSSEIEEVAQFNISSVIYCVSLVIECKNPFDIKGIRKNCARNVKTCKLYLTE